MAGMHPNMAGMHPGMYPGMAGMAGMHPGMMQASKLEVPLSSGAVSVNLTTVHPGKHVLSSRADYENLLRHLTAWREEASCETDEAYKELIGKNYFGMTSAQGSGNWADWSKNWGAQGMMGGNHPFWAGQGVTPQYERNALPELTRELLDNKQIDETIVYAARGTKQNLARGQFDLESEAEQRQDLLDRANLDGDVKANLTMKAKPHHEVESKFFEDPRYLYTSDSNGVVKQISLRLGEVSCDFGNRYHNKVIYCICSTKNSKFLFTSDDQGNFKQISVVDGEVVKDYGKIFKATITSMASCPNSRYVIVGDENGNIKQFDVNTRTLTREYKKALPGACLTISVTSDSESFFVAGSQGNCKQYGLSDGKIVREFGKVHKGSIFSICVTADSNYLFTSDKYGYVKQFGVRDGLLVKDYGKVMERFIYAMATTPNSQYLYISGNRGCMKQYDIRSQECLRDFGRVHMNDSDICCLVVGPNSKFLWTSDDSGNLKEWDIKKGELLRDFGKVHDGRVHGMTCVH